MGDLEATSVHVPQLSFSWQFKSVIDNTKLCVAKKIRVCHCWKDSLKGQKK